MWGFKSYYSLSPLRWCAPPPTGRRPPPHCRRAAAGTQYLLHFSGFLRGCRHAFGATDAAGTHKGINQKRKIEDHRELHRRGCRCFIARGGTRISPKSRCIPPAEIQSKTTKWGYFAKNTAGGSDLAIVIGDFPAASAATSEWARGLHHDAPPP